jgi:hypothetical protein
MRREAGSLIFESHEEDKFYRALRFLGRVKGYSSSVMDELVKHEKEHVGAADDLGCRDRINYIVKSEGAGVMGGVNLSGLENWERFHVSLSPRYPSAQDFRCAASACGDESDPYLNDKVSLMLRRRESRYFIKSFLFLVRPTSFP